MDGRSRRPSASGMTRGIPAASTWATRLLVVPRSMPTMRDMRLCVLSQGLAQVLDDGAQVGPGGQALLESIDERPTVRSAVHRGILLGRPGCCIEAVDQDRGVRITGVAVQARGPDERRVATLRQVVQAPHDLRVLG